MATLRLRVVLYQEDGYWVAHSLELDAIGVGTSQKAAFDELRGNVEAQLSFAKFKGLNPFRPAPVEIQRLWEDVNLSALGLAGERKGAARAKVARVMKWDRQQVEQLTSRKPRFECAL